jgi:hypothetical protein
VPVESSRKHPSANRPDESAQSVTWIKVQNTKSKGVQVFRALRERNARIFLEEKSLGASQQQSRVQVLAAQDGFQSVKLQRPGRTTVCSHSPLGDKAASLV